MNQELQKLLEDVREQLRGYENLTKSEFSESMGAEFQDVMNRVCEALREKKTFQ